MKSLWERLNVEYKKKLIANDELTSTISPNYWEYKLKKSDHYNDLDIHEWMLLSDILEHESVNYTFLNSFRN